MCAQKKIPAEKMFHNTLNNLYILSRGYIVQNPCTMVMKKLIGQLSMLNCVGLYMRVTVE